MGIAGWAGPWCAAAGTYSPPADMGGCIIPAAAAAWWPASMAPQWKPGAPGIADGCSNSRARWLPPAPPTIPPPAAPPALPPPRCIRHPSTTNVDGISVVSVDRALFFSLALLDIIHSNVTTHLYTACVPRVTLAPSPPSPVPPAPVPGTGRRRPFPVDEREGSSIRRGSLDRRTIDHRSFNRALRGTVVHAAWAPCGESRRDSWWLWERDDDGDGDGDGDDDGDGGGGGGGGATADAAGETGVRAVVVYPLASHCSRTDPNSGAAFSSAMNDAPYSELLDGGGASAYSRPRDTSRLHSLSSPYPLSSPLVTLPTTASPSRDHVRARPRPSMLSPLFRRLLFPSCIPLRGSIEILAPRCYHREHSMFSRVSI